MSLAGPVLSIQPSTVVSSLSAMQSPSENSSIQSSQLAVPLQRERANSETDVHAIIEKNLQSPSPLISFDVSVIV